MDKHPTLFKKDSKGKIRVWWMEVDASKYRTVSGLEDGKKVISSWQIATEKNVGKANSTTAKEQALLEVASRYDDQLSKYYFSDKNDIDIKKIFSPMLAVEYEKNKNKITFPTFIQPKLDGVRCVITKDGAFSRSGKPFFTCDNIIKSYAPIFKRYPDAVLDGELYNHSLNTDFEKLVGIIKRKKISMDQQREIDSVLQHHLYDVCFDDETSFSVRNNIVCDIFYEIESINSPIKLVLTAECQSSKDLDDWNDYFIKEGYEGSIIRPDVSYKKGPSRNLSLIKRKKFFEEEYAIVDIIEGKGNWAGYAKSIKCIDDGGQEFNAGIRGNQDLMKRLLEEKDDYIEGKGVASVRYPSKTKSGKPRFGVVKTLWKHGRDL